jgi:transcriptional regulator with XRE-family HTH domain
MDRGIRQDADRETTWTPKVLTLTEMLGQEVKACRGPRTLAEVAEAAGIHRSYLCDIEKGRRLPPPEMIRRLATALEVEPDRWLWWWAAERMGVGNATRAAVYRFSVPVHIAVPDPTAT